MQIKDAAARGSWFHVTAQSSILCSSSIMSPPSAIEVEAVTDTSGVTIPDPLSAPLKSNEISGRRKKAPKSQWVVAAHADSINFRQRPNDHKPKARNWDRKCYPADNHICSALGANAGRPQIISATKPRSEKGTPSKRLPGSWETRASFL